MRILAFISSIVISTAFLMAGIILLVFETSDTKSAWTFVAVFPLIIFVYGPLTMGSFRAYWNVTGSTDSKRYYRRVVLLVGALEVLGAIVTVIFATLTSAGPLIPIVFIGGGVVFTIAALVIGPALYRHHRAHPRSQPAWVAIEKSEITKRIVATALTFLGVLVVGLIGIGIVSMTAPTAPSFPQMLILAFSLAFTFSAVVCVISTLGWNQRLIDVTERDPLRLRRVARVVLRKKPLDLDAGDLVAAARYAAVASVTLSFQLGYIVLLYAGLVLIQINALRDGFAATMSIVIIIVLVVILAALLPLQLVRIRRARRYARLHANDLV